MKKENKDSLNLLIDETREMIHRGDMDVPQNEVESEFELWPIEHPTEPLDEDLPVKCPMSDSSLVNDGRTREQWFLRKRQEVAAAVNKKGVVVVAEPPVRSVRKRHHTLTRGDQTSITPLLRMPPLYPYPPNNITIFDMLQQFNKFE